MLLPAACALQPLPAPRAWGHPDWKTDIYRATVPTVWGKPGELASRQQQQYRGWVGA